MNIYLCIPIFLKKEIENSLISIEKCIIYGRYIIKINGKMETGNKSRLNEVSRSRKSESRKGKQKKI